MALDQFHCRLIPGGGCGNNRWRRRLIQFSAVGGIRHVNACVFLTCQPGRAGRIRPERRAGCVAGGWSLNLPPSLEELIKRLRGAVILFSRGWPALFS